MTTEIVCAPALLFSTGGGHRIRSLNGPAKHVDLLRTLNLACAPLAVHGFLTSAGRFLNRQEARAVAEAAGQLVPGAMQSKWLYAEDLGW